MYGEVALDFNPVVKELCKRPYYNHPHGCPNHGVRPTCPPRNETIWGFLDESKPTWVIYNRFDFGSHVERMRTKHPEWSQRQAECCLYWQGTARKQLREITKRFVSQSESNTMVITTPEALGVNLTSTMKKIGVYLEWPPKKWAFQIVVAGSKK